MKKRAAVLLLAGAMTASVFTGCGGQQEAKTDTVSTETNSQEKTAEEKTIAETADAPKYVFLFIGDGMSYPQIQLTNYFLNASQDMNKGTATVKDEEKTILDSKNQLVMMDFPVAGSAQTYDSTSFAPDSASTATSIATGYKTWSGSINVSENFQEKYETIAEKLKEQQNYKIGVVSSVNLNHATPAAFYAHQESRNNYYEIGLELIDSGFDYFAGAV